jgi:tetratricopeptide (TPR) repeat protein/DNA-binding CsgD family transcriptional regulator
MRIATTNCLRLFILFVILQTNYFSFSQDPVYPYREWVKKLSDKKAPVFSGVFEISSALKDKQISEVSAVFNELGSKGSSSGSYFEPRLNFTKAIWFRNSNLPGWFDSTQQLFRKALNAAYEIDNDSLISTFCWQYGSMMYWIGDIEQAAMYSLYAAEQDEKAGIRSRSGDFGLLGDLLYKTRDYERAMFYTKKSTEGLPDTVHSKSRIMSNQNTIALCWQRMEKYDSAFFYFDDALRMAKELKDSLWISIISGNEGQIFFAQKNYPVAKQLLEYDYHQSKKFGELASAANSLQWVARIDLLEGRKDSALYRVKECLKLLDPASSSNYWENVYYATADVYKALGNADSAYKYAQLYNQTHDLIERKVANSRLEISRIKLENLQNSLAIKNLHREKQAEELKRNFLLVAIVMLSVIIILILNRQRQRSLHKKRLAEAESISAKEQLAMFRQNIIEKTNLIEKLQAQVEQKETTAEQFQILDELSQQTILTENDWERFKKLFEKIHPGFFVKLKERSIDITVAEQRMAALTRLHLTAKQMASMLGISPISVHKTRQRLKQRLQLDSEASLEEEISRV